MGDQNLPTCLLPGKVMIYLYLECIFKANCIFQDWEDYIYIDPTVIGSAVMWLLNYQTPEGSFAETEWYPHPLHKPMDGRSRFYDDYSTMRNISLTAHVLISLEVAAPNLQV